MALSCVVVIGGALAINMPYWPRLIVRDSPLLTLLISAFLDSLWQVLERSTALSIPAALAALGTPLAIANGNYQWYFNHFVPTTRASYIAAAKDVGTFLHGVSPTTTVYGLTDGTFYMNNETITFLAPRASTCTVSTELDFGSCAHQPTIRSIVLIFQRSSISLQQIRMLYPHGHAHILRTYDLGQSIYIYSLMK